MRALPLVSVLVVSSLSSLAHAGGKIDIDVGGGPIAFTKAFVWKTASGALAFDISSEKKPTCDSVRDAHRKHEAHEENIAGTIEDTLQSNGKITKRIHTMMFLNEDLVEDTPVTVSGSGKTMTLKFAFKHDERKLAGGTFPVSAKGTITAAVCPAESAATPTAKEMPATITVAGKKLAVRGAQLQSQGDTRALILVTGDDGCEWTDPTSELVVGLVWDKAADKKITIAQLTGRWIGVPAKHTNVSVAHDAPSATGDFELHVATKVEGYDVKVDGKVTARVCKN